MRTPRRTSWFASMSPVGPAPTIRTSVSTSIAPDAAGACRARRGEGARQVGPLLDRDRPGLVAPRAVGLDVRAAVEQLLQLVARVTGLHALVAAARTLGCERCRIAHAGLHAAGGVGCWRLS